MTTSIQLGLLQCQNKNCITAGNYRNGFRRSLDKIAQSSILDVQLDDSSHCIALIDQLLLCSSSTKKTKDYLAALRRAKWL